MCRLERDDIQMPIERAACEHESQNDVSKNRSIEKYMNQIIFPD